MKVEKFISRFVNQSIKKKNLCNLILSGGKSPVALYKIIEKLRLNFKKINLTLLDERIVKKTSKHLNYNLIKKIFIKKDKEVIIYDLLKEFKNNSTNKIIKEYKKSLPLTIAGIGKDGHFASIFYNSRKYSKLIDLKQKRNFLKIEKNGKPFVARITMNLSLILCSKKILIILNSKLKKKIFCNAIDSKSKYKLPVSTLIDNAKNKLVICDGKKLMKYNDFIKKNNIKTLH